MKGNSDEDQDQDEQRQLIVKPQGMDRRDYDETNEDERSAAASKHDF